MPNVMKEKLNFRLINYVILIIIILFAFFVRFNNLDKHFSHIDDLIAPSVATASESKGLEKINERLNLSNQEEETLLTFYPYFKPFLTAIGVGKISTYAPLQFLMTGAIVNDDMSYRDILFYSRMISFIAGFLSILLIIYICLKLYGEDNIVYAIFGATILSFSWEHIIYSMQSESYAIGLLVALMSFILYGAYITKKSISKKESLYLGLILSLLIFTNYQFLFFIPGFYLAILISYKNNYIKFFSSYILSILVLLFSTLILYKVFLSSLTSSGINWNAGPNKEFLFDLSSQNNIFETVEYVFNFFIQNTYYVFRNLISFASERSIFNDIITIIYMLLFFIGLFSFYKSKNIVKKHFVYFFLTTSIIWILLIVMQKLTLSPTRHSLILLSFILIFTPAGLIHILEKYNLNKNLIIGIFTVGIVLLFSLNYKSVMDKRIDMFNPNHIEKLIKKYDITEIYEYSWTYNLNYMKYVKDNFDREGGGLGAMYLFKKNLQKNNNVLFITHMKRPLSKEIKKHFLKISGRSLSSPIKITYKEEHISDTEICFGNQTKNGTNSLLIYIVNIGEE